MGSLYPKIAVRRRILHLYLAFELLTVCCVASMEGQQRTFMMPAKSFIAAPDPGQNRTYCRLSGRVTTPDGEPLSGATVQLSGPTISLRESLTDRDGRVVLEDLPPGIYKVTVTRDGFTPVDGTVRLASEANAATATFLLRPALNQSVSVSASEKDIAEAQIQLAEQQRLAGIVPNFFVSYIWKATPLTSAQKFRLALKNSADPGNLLLVGTVAAYQQATNSFPGYSQGWKGYGRRYGADLGNLVSGTFLGGAVLPSLFRQDPRYFYKGTGPIPSRLWYALSRTVITRGDNGRSQPNYSTVLGDLSSGALSNLYYAPEDRRGAKVTFTNGLLGIAGDAMNNVFQEFVLKKLTTNSKRNSVNP